MAGSNQRLTPRQKMINLMYIVLTAMLALNVSSDVLDGFMQVEDGLARTNEHVEGRNNAIYTQLSDFADQNPEKGSMWLEKAQQVREFAGRMYDMVDSLKMAIVEEADGKGADPADIQHRDDLESAAVVMLNPSSRRGERLRNSVDTYRLFVTALVADSAKRASIESALSTEPFRRKGTALAQSW
ncbi:MAG: gliding motility protein GldM, partial [Paramuribaculum sp.]|nr:gliding motility protein GldM [Paramuribaculum sp.]